jgi:S1-C subfamily serine protease
VFDREVGKVIYRQETQGVAQAEGVNNLAATYEAIRASFKVLLNEPTLVATLTQPSTTESAVLATAYEIPAIASADESLSLEQLVGRSIPSIVQIQTPVARGSGFLIGSSGLVVTNQHVIDSAFSVKVNLYDGSTHTARVLKRDASYDVALLQLNETVEAPTGLPICHTNAVKVGEAVVAIGNPLALSNTVTQGVVSGFRFDSSRNLIQTDAAINPGNSGGPLLNRQGAVIGIVTEKMVSRGVEGLGFALPIGEALHRLHVQIQSPVGSLLNSCGSPTATGLVLTASGVSNQ